jgi:hypothetical protein
MMKDIVVEEDRPMKVIDAGGKSSQVVMNTKVYDPDTDQVRQGNDLAKANFEVDVDVGPSSSSRRAATVRALTGMMQLTQDPETLQVLNGLVMMNLEGEGISEAREYFRRKMVRMGVVKPTDEEAAELAQEQEQANAQPDPQSQALLAMAEESEANAASARASTVQKVADANLKQAQTAKTFAEAAGSHNEQLIASVQALQQLLNPGPGTATP